MIPVESNGGYLDTFSGLLGDYFTYKTEEAKAEASGAAQAQHASTVETTANVNQTPNNTGSIGSAGFNLSTNQMMIGGALLLGAILVFK